MTKKKNDGPCKCQGAATDTLNSLVSFEVGQVWQTSRGYFWKVTTVFETGQAALICSVQKRIIFRRRPNRLWKLVETNSQAQPPCA